MKISKLEGIKLLSKFKLPTVELLNIQQILDGKISIEDGVSIRLSPKNHNVRWNVGLPSINRRTDISEIRDFINKYQNEYYVFAHKSVRPESIGTLSRMKEVVVLENYKSYEDKGDEIINNRAVIPIVGDKYFVSKMTLLKKDKQDFNNFRKVLMYLSKIPFSEYEMEYVIQNEEPIFMDFTVLNNREYTSYKDIYEIDR